MNSNHLDNELAQEGELLAELRELLEAKANEVIADLAGRLESGELAGAAEQAHSLAGMAGTLGLERLRLCALDLEQQFLDAAPRPADAHREETAALLHGLLDESLRALDGYLLQRG